MRANAMRALLALGFVAGVALSASAYTTLDAQDNPRWANGLFNYVINASSFSNAGLAPSAVQSSFSTWAAVPQTDLTTVRGADTLGLGAQNGINEAVYINSGFPAGQGVLAITYTRYNLTTNFMIEADVLVNGEDFSWDSPTTCTGSASSDPFDLAATVTHEAGHALGLGHSSEDDLTCVPTSGLYDQGLCEATMYYAGGPCDTSTQTLECDDMAGIRFLYPPAAAPANGLPRADWTRSGFTAVPSGGDIAPGVNVIINGTATNTGSISTVAGNSGLYVNTSAAVPGGSPVATQQLLATAYCDTRSVNFTRAFTAGESGTRYLVVKLDSGNTTTELSESDTSNVAFFGPYNVVAGPVLTTDKDALTFNGNAGGSNPASQAVLVTNTGGGTFTWSTSENASWLSIAPTSGAPGASFTVSVNTSGLAAGTHDVDIIVTATGATGSPKTIPVTLNLVSSAILNVAPTSLTFSAVPGGASPPSQQLNISNGGGGTLDWTASETASWLSVAPASGTNAGAVTVSVNTTGLAAGQYMADVTIADPAAAQSPATIPVTLTISSSILSVVPDNLSFSGPVGGPAPPSQQLAVTNAGSGAMSYTASSNQSWLSVAPTSGNAPANLTVSVNPAGQTAGTKTGAITVTAAGAAGSPMTIPVSYTLSTQPSIGLSPTSLSFAAQQGGAATPQDLTITNDGAGTLSYSVSDDAAWLSVGNPAGTLTQGSSRAHSVSASAASLAAGTYTATITVVDPAANDSPKTVAVTFEVGANPPLAISPLFMTFAATATAPTPASQSLSISTGGSASATWSIASDRAWLSVAPSSGSGDAVVQVTASAAQGVPTGANLGTLTVTAPALSGSPKTLPVTLNVAAGPRLSVSPLVATWAVDRLAPVPGGVSVSVTNAGSGALNWTATGMPSWLSATPASGTAPGSFTLQPTRTDLAAGRYTATVNVSAPNSYDTPQAITVTYDIIGPALTFAPERVAFSVVGGVPGATSVTVDSSGAGAWTATANRPWLSVSPTSGSGNATLTVSLVGGAALPVGLLDGAVIVTQSGASNSPAPIPVTVHSRPLPALSVWPEEIVADAVAGTSVQPIGVVLLDEAGDGAGAWTLGARPSWLRVDIESGAHGARLALSIDPTGLAAGVHEGSLVIDAEDGALELPLDVTLRSTPALHAAPTSLSLAAVAGGVSVAQDLVVTNVGAAPGAFTATPSQPWLLVTGSLVAPSTLQVSASAATLGAGSHSAMLTLAAGTNRVDVPVTVTVAPAGAPLADFTMAPVGGCMPLVIAVDNLTTGATSQQWLIDGVVASTFLEGSLPAITKPGEHVVTLRATNASGTTSRSRSVVATLPPLAWAGRDRSVAFEADGQTRVELVGARAAAAAPARLASLTWTTSAGTFEDSGTTTSTLERPALVLSSGRGGVSAVLTLSVTDDRGCTASDQMLISFLSDLDSDADGKIALLDNCPTATNSSQADFDLDGVGDPCDSCPTTADATQADRNANLQGDACEASFRKAVTMPDLRARACQLVASIPVATSTSASPRRVRLDLTGGRAPSGATALGLAAASGGTGRVTPDGAGVELLVPASLRFDQSDMLALELPLLVTDQQVAVPCAGLRVGFVFGELAGTCDSSALDLRADGDVTGPSGPNGVVDVGDVVKLLRVSVNLDTLDADGLARGDIAPGSEVGGIWRANSDCRIDVGDVVIALRASVGLITMP